MNIFKRINLNDEYNYLPDNLTIGTFSYWKRKYGDKFDDTTYIKWEAMSTIDDEKQKTEILRKIQEHNKQYVQKLLSELEQRNNENIISDNIIEIDEQKPSELSNSSE